ncbi:AraC family transcriptional regulator [Pseudomonas sp.]|uniref:AraC family transcriptional regulator n=1 Tax=Pseudomonas sp. TaxID=306 RepID=UPI00258785F9|nr:AraC family transcriptional regulator [Pseudomonas sp.]
MHSISAVLAQALMNAVVLARPHATDPNVTFSGTPSPGAGGVRQIPLDELNEFFLRAQRHSGSEDIGLLAYQRAHPGNLGVLGYAIMSSPTLRCALKCITDFYPTVGTGFCLYLDEQPTLLRIVGASADSSTPPFPRVFLDAIAALTLGLLHWLTPNTRIMPLRAEFTYPKPHDTQPLETLFGPHLVFSAAVNAMTFSCEDADLPIATFDASLQQIHNDYLSRKTSELINDTLITRLRRAVMQRLYQAQSLMIEDVARSMNLSVHQLTRSLKIEGVSFQRQVDLARRQYSQHLLINTGLTLKQISYRLCFKNQSAFNKACERWFGMSPGRYRSSGQSSVSHAGN